MEKTLLSCDITTEAYLISHPRVQLITALHIWLSNNVISFLGQIGIFSKLVCFVNSNIIVFQEVFVGGGGKLTQRTQRSS